MGLLSLLCLVLPASARADNFTFSFTNVPTGDGDDISGTVTGEILGLTNDSTGPAAEVLILSFPPGLDSVLGSGPIYATSWSDQIENSFTVTNGQVTAGGFYAWDTLDSVPYGAQLYINGLGAGFNEANLDGVEYGPAYVQGADGLAAANIQPAPEPPSLALLGVGLLGLLGLKRRFQVPGVRCAAAVSDRPIGRSASQ
jgi:hypothetical protein